MKYFSTTTCQDVEINLATADIADVSNAYSSLLSMSDDDGAFPGSKKWVKAKVFGDQLNALVAARPEIEAYRRDRAAEKRAVRLSGADVFGV